GCRGIYCRRAARRAHHRIPALGLRGRWVLGAGRQYVRDSGCDRGALPRGQCHQLPREGEGAAYQGG
ncbi:unnamed protein product, partial [Ectocarpus sp. 4 AP-2014]